MRIAVDPLIDCVFIALFSANENQNLLIHFLNALLAGFSSTPIVAVTLANPYNIRQFIGEKFTIVDVKAIDSTGRLYQIEVQFAVHKHLGERVLFGHSEMYAGQLREGHGYGKLHPVISVWVLKGELFPDRAGYHHEFAMRTSDGELCLCKESSIHIVELKKYKETTMNTELDRWSYFLKQGSKLDPECLPDSMQTPEIRQAMKILEKFSLTGEDRYLYEARLKHKRLVGTLSQELEEVKRSIQEAEREKQEAMREKQEATVREQEAMREKQDAMVREQEAMRREQEAMSEKQDAMREKQDTEQENARLRALLQDAGLNPQSRS